MNLKIWKFSFSVHFSKMSSRRQAKLITIYRIPGFSLFISFWIQCNTCFQYAISWFAKTYRNNFASNFLQVAVCGIHMSKRFIGYHILLLELISFQKYNRQNTDNGRTSITSCAYRDFISCNIIADFWYCLVCCILYSTKSKETSMKRYASAHVSLKYRQCIFYSLLRAYCFPNNFNLNLVE